MSGTTRAEPLIWPRFWQGLRRWFSSTKQVLWNFRSGFLPISSLFSNRWLTVLDGESFEEYPLNASISQGSILDPTLFLLYINDLALGARCNIAIYEDENSIYSKWDQVSELCELDLASKLEFDLQDNGLGQEETRWFQCWKNSIFYSTVR